MRNDLLAMLNTVVSGLRPRKGLGQVGIIGVADKVDADVLPIRLQRLCGHARTQIGAADTDVNQVGNRFAGNACVGAV